MNSGAFYPRVVIGKDGWRFLGDGTNLAMSQVTGRISPTQETVNAWCTVLQSRLQRYGHQTMTFIVPEKAKLYRNKVPDDIIVKIDGLATWLCAVGYAGYLFLDYLPSGDAGHLYHKVDSHTTGYGGYLAACGMMDALGLAGNDFRPEWETTGAWVYDLLEPGEEFAGATELQAANFPQIAIKTNGVSNRGCVMTLHNPEGGSGKIMLFGDSFSSFNIASGLAMRVRDVIFVHSAAFDYEIVERVQPDYIIGEIAERFLIDAPSEAVSLAYTMQTKVLEDRLSRAEIESFLSSYDAMENIYGRVMNPIRRQMLSIVD